MAAKYTTGTGVVLSTTSYFPETKNCYLPSNVQIAIFILLLLMRGNQNVQDFKCTTKCRAAGSGIIGN